MSEKTLEDHLNDSVADLTSRITELWNEKREEARTQQKEREKELKEAIKEERTLKKKIEESRKIVKKMEAQFFEMEAKIQEEERREIEKSTPLEEQVRSGEISLEEFQEQGMTNSEISKKIVEKSMTELQESLKAIREKNKEILQLEKKLLETQSRIRGMIIAPAQILQRAIKDCKEITDERIGSFLSDAYGSRQKLKEAENRLFLTEGKSLGAGYQWSRLAPEKAKAIQFDPILPAPLIPSLLEQIEANRDKEFVIVQYHLGRGKDPGTVGTVDISTHGVIRIPETKSNWRPV